MRIQTEGATRVTLDFSPGIFISTQRDEDGTDKQLITLQVRTDGVIQMKLPDADFTTLTMALLRHARNEGILPIHVLLAEVKRSMSEEEILKELNIKLPDSDDEIHQRFSPLFIRRENAQQLAERLLRELDDLHADITELEEKTLQ